MISENFSLEEFTFSQTASRHGIDNRPSSEIVANIERLVTTLLQPIRTDLGKPIKVTSGYRSFAVNSAVGGARGSKHMKGLAADIVVSGMSAMDLAVFISNRRKKYPYEKLILEFNSWVHVEVPETLHSPINRKAYTARRTVEGTRYYDGLISEVV